MRNVCGVTAIAILAVVRMAYGAASLTATDLTVGRNLQTYGTVRLTEVAPDAGVRITVTSDDPKRLVLSDGIDKAGSASITLTVRPQRFESPEFWVHGLADHGTVTYTVTAAGISTAKGTVTLVPSAILILGPFRQLTFPTTPRGVPAKISLFSAALDPSMKILEEQQIAGGSRMEVNIANSNPEAGAVGESKLIFTGATSSAATYFKPAAEGVATLTPNQPPGFSTPAEFATVNAAVEKPGLAVTNDVLIGKDLQVVGVLCLGESPGPEGLSVTLTSSDGNKLLLSPREDQLGSASITLNLKAGELVAKYYLQSLSDAGAITYKATAQGFKTRTAQIVLTKSGVIVAYGRYGPPDEAAVLRNTGAHDDRRFYASLADSKEHPIHLVVWSVHLDPATGLAADMTVEDLRPGVSATVDLKSSNPGIGTVESPVTIQSGSNHSALKFIPVSKGETVVSVSTPSGFSTPNNATKVPAVVMD
jgi:hypothetical protein